MKGEGNQQDYGMRVYDPRIAKFLSVDPLTPKYPELTPYQFASNRPIDGIDLDGLEHLRYDELKEAIKSHSPRLENGNKISNPFLRGLYNAAKILAPVRPADDSDPQNVGEVVENLKELPSHLSKIPSSLKKLYSEGTLDQKIEGTTTIVLTAAALVKGRGSGLQLEGMALKGMTLNWAWKSVKTFGHIFTQHGAQLKISQLADRARSFGVAIGQWTNNEKAAEFIKGIYDTLKDGENIVDIPAGLGQVVNADQSVISATKAIIVKNAEGATNALKTGYPIVEKVVR